MRTGAARRVWGAVASLAVVLTLNSGCTALEGEEPASSADAAAVLVDDVREALKKRERAVRQGKRRAFIAGLAPSRALREQQGHYFDNLQQLPLAKFAYRIADASVQRISTSSSEHVQVDAELVLKLDGFDEAATRTPLRMLLQRNDAGRLVLTDPAVASFAAARRVMQQPWDLGPIAAVHGSGVLAVTDVQGTSAQTSISEANAVARGVHADVLRAATTVRTDLPFDWAGGVVVYGLRSPTFASSLENIPGGDAERLDGITFPVPITPGAARNASVRFLLHPRMLQREDGARNRLIRHELVHVALAERDDDVPTWLAEGLAEYVAAKSIPSEQRMIASDAVNAARAGVSAMPSDADFNGVSSSANYGLSWYACEYIAQTWGEATLWKLFDAARQAPDSTPSTMERVLRDTIGIDAPALAQRSAARILAVFG